MTTIGGRPSETLVAMAQDALGRLTGAEHEQVLARLARSQPTLMLDAIHAVERPRLT